MSEATTLNLGCGKHAHPELHNVDAIELPGVDEVVDLDETPWPWATDEWQRIIAEHVLEHLASVETALAECARVLEPGGQLVTRWPVGYDARADPDHEHEWYWRTPEFFTGARHWGADVGLTVVDRDVDLETLQHGAGWHLHQWYLDAKLRRYGPGPWCFVEPGCRGVFTVVFEA